MALWKKAAMEKIMWLVLGGVTFGAAWRAGKSRRAQYVGRVALGVLFIAFGAVVNAPDPIRFREAAGCRRALVFLQMAGIAPSLEHRKVV
jgi:hypothetical protein